MPRYYFDFQDGDEYAEDDVGTELPNPEAAREEAGESLLAIARDRLPNGASSAVLSVIVKDEFRSALLTIRIVYEETSAR